MPTSTSSKPKSRDSFALHLLHRAGQVARQLFVDQLRRQGVTPRQFALLLAISAKPGRSQSELVQSSGIDRSTMADMISRLAERGLIEKNSAANDRRATSIKLANAGRRLLRKCEDGASAAEARMLAPMTPARRRNFLSSLALIVETETLKEPVKKPKRASRA